jgi:hypothetical protein
MELGKFNGRAARSAVCSVHSLKFQEYPSYGSRDTDEKVLPSPTNFLLLQTGRNETQPKLAAFWSVCVECEVCGSS